LGPVAERHPLPVQIAYHDACHLAHGQGIRSQPRELLRSIPELELREINRAELCCGSAGIYNLLNPQTARELGDRKTENILATGAQLLVTANPGCSMQIRTSLERRGEKLPMAHTVQVLDASIRGLAWTHCSPPAEQRRPVNKQEGNFSAESAGNVPFLASGGRAAGRDRRPLTVTVLVSHSKWRTCRNEEARHTCPRRTSTTRSAPRADAGRRPERCTGSNRSASSQA